VVAASLTAYVVGEFANSFVLAKMKVLTGGKHLWMRTIGSTLVGQLVDSAVFYPLAFLGTEGWTLALIARVGWNNYLLKVALETLFTPLTYVVVNFLKREEREDVFDSETDFNPLKLRSCAAQRAGRSAGSRLAGSMPSRRAPASYRPMQRACDSRASCTVARLRSSIPPTRAITSAEGSPPSVGNIARISRSSRSLSRLPR
jgi:hypothetical protein